MKSSNDQAEEIEGEYDFSLKSGETADLLLYYSGSEITSDLTLSLCLSSSDYTEILSEYILTTDDIK